MKITLGKDGLVKTYQKEFSETTKCCRCGRTVRPGFVAHEGMLDNDKKGPYVCDQYLNMGKRNYWLHNSCTVAVYFCEECLETTALYNQG